MCSQPSGVSSEPPHSLSSVESSDLRISYDSAEEGLHPSERGTSPTHAVELLPENRL